MMSKRYFLAALAFLLAAAVPSLAQEKKILDEIVVRVNNEIITLSDVARARAALDAEVDEECRQSACTAEQRAKLIEEKEKNLLRDLIDQSLLIQRGKDAGISVTSECVRRMDLIRQQNNISNMEELEKAVNSTGLSFEDWKANLCNSILTQEVLRKEVRPDITVQEVKDFYEKHKEQFVKPERVFLSEIFVNTEGQPEAELPKLEEKARTLRTRVVDGGEDFNELAKRFSDGSTADRGGFLGDEGFARDGLAPEISEVVFKMKRGDVTQIIRTKTGFLILKVEQRFEAGQQPLDKVENEIQNRIYMEKMRPAMREYLTRLREESYVLVKPGYTDSAGVAVLPITEVEAPKPEEDDEPRKKRKKFLWIIPRP
jgi:peptidyl-prolyl cis-trans isomerase SurA